ncbi:MAG: hypothetical protein AAGE52_29620 [Myxococcota bacterium]
MHFATRSSFVFVAALLFADSGMLAAQDAPPEEYRALFMEGSREWADGHFEEALVLFTRAHEIFPNARSHRAIGLVSYETRSYVDSVTHLSAALSDSRRALNDEQRQDAERVLALGARFVGRYQIETSVDGFLEVDGEPRAQETVLVLARGEHTLRVTATGYHPEEQAVRVRGGESESLTFTLVEAGPETQTPNLNLNPNPNPTPDPVDEETSGATRAGRGALAAGVGLIAVGVLSHALYANARSAHRSSVSQGGCLPRVDGSVPESEVRSECLEFQDRWQRSRPWIGVGYGLGAAAAITGTVLLLVGRKSEDREDLSVSCSSHGTVGMSCSGRF